MAADDKDWTPRLNAQVDYSKLDLIGEEGFLLSRLDGSTSVTHLTHLTGMPQGKIKQILGRLIEQGAVEADGAPGAAVGSRARMARGARRTPADEEVPDDLDLRDDDLVEGPPTLVDGAPAQSAEDQRGADAAVNDPLDEATLHDDPAADDGARGDEGAADQRAPEDDEEDDEDEDEEAGDEAYDLEDEEALAGDEEAPEEDEHGRTWRRVFEEELHPLDIDERVKLARTASGVTLCALCFDPNPRVIGAILDNTKIGLQHGRLIAEHHRVSTGLDTLARRIAFVRDRQVQRFLFRNPQLSDRLFRRILQPKRMADTYRLTTNRDTTDRVRNGARKAFRQKFTQGTAEERVQIIIKTEGRCLAQLIGIGIDGRTTSLLCGRPIHSTLLVQNLARWASTPPPILVHLGKQPIVKRSPMLKNLLLRHPNAPAQLKKQLK